MSGSRCTLVLALPLLLGFGSPAMAASPEPESSPEPEPAALPDYTTPAVPEPEPPRRLEVPPDGKAAFGFAGVSFGYALLGFGGVANLLVRGDSSVFWGLSLGAAIPATIMGAVAVGVGVRNQRRYRAWAAETGIEAPPQGTGLVGTGAMLIVGGSAAVTIASVSALFNGGIEWAEPTPTPLDPLSIGLGATSVAVGSVLLIAGAARSGRFKRWRASQVTLMPTLTPLGRGEAAREGGGRGFGGLSFGVVGRF